ncbi:MAG: DnaJ domain-containing protein [Verrucomicrobiota bacterium]|jgi:molecular chaperone DnaJ
MSRNYYLILGIASDASDDDIKSAFRRRAMELHPDTSGLESGPFLELQEAYGVLSDPQRRRLYDRKAQPVSMRRRPWGPVAEPLVRERKRGNPFRPPASSRDFLEILPAEVFEQERPAFDELFERLLRNFEYVSQPKSETRESFAWEVVISQEEARCGGRVRVNVPARATCPACGGHGVMGFCECWRCEGHGALAAAYPVEAPYPPGIRDGFEVQIPLDRFGVENLYVTLLFRVSDGW